MLAVLARAHSPEGSADSTGRLPLSVRIRRAVAQQIVFCAASQHRMRARGACREGVSAVPRHTSREQKLAQIMPARLSCAGLPWLWRA